ncbi:U6 snRNA-associated Sm-like protein LSm8 [Mycena sanguinolenta]|uniref:LSM2-LSM8 complex subunit LSM8 n=1 Tax=Mycena sanguinolenta TaxID=230812 RepID=A0A8H6Y3T2_9AGAR|nr:U6 snRNA-associated Sm-like protein LSm8 [Mycena sanguinolenta]
MSSLQGYVDRRVIVILQDGRVIVGVLAGFDQKSNIVLSDSKERIYSMDAGVEEVPLGLYLVKGDMIVLIGEVDDAVDQAVLRGHALGCGPWARAPVWEWPVGASKITITIGSKGKGKVTAGSQFCPFSACTTGVQKIVRPADP